MKSLKLATILTAANIISGNDCFWNDSPAPQKKKELKKCLLPTCQKEHNHKNSFCCAEHCREYNELQKTKRKGKP